MTQHSDNRDLVDTIYAVAMEPERLHELVDVWQERMNSIRDENLPNGIDDTDYYKRHLSRADSILSLMMENEDILPTPLQEKLNSESQAVLALSPDCVVTALNSAAQTLFDITEGAKISDLPISEDAVHLIRKEVRRLNLQSVKKLSAPGIFRLARNDDSGPLLITFSTLETLGGRRFVLLKTTDFIWPDYLTPLIEKAFELTKAESAVVKLIVEGNSVEAISNTRGTSIKTVRFQIRSIYAKTSTNSQSEFIRMAIGLTTLQLVDKDVLTGAYQRSLSHAAQAYPRPEHERLLSLPDGRILDYAVFGHPDGKPCVFFHNEYFGNVWPANLARLAEKNGLKIITPARPYCARSSPYPADTIPYKQFTKDLNRLMMHLNIKRAVHISQTSGGLYSLAYTLEHSDKVVARVDIAPMLPMPTVQDEDRMTKMGKFSANLVKRHPYMLKFITKSGWIYHNRVGSQRFLETMIINTKPDLDIITDQKNVDAIIRGFQFVTTNGYMAFYQDYFNISRGPWDEFSKITCPVYNIIGTEDKNSRAKRADRAIASGMNLNKIIAKGGGEMLFFSHPELIVDTLVKAWETG